MQLAILGRAIGLQPGQRVVDFGCGYGEALVLWASCFGVSGLGLDSNPDFFARAQALATAHGMQHLVRILHADASTYDCGSERFDLTACIGASGLWGGFGPALRAMRPILTPAGRAVIGEPYYTTSEVPPGLLDYEGPFHTEQELFELANTAGFDVGYVARSSQAEWDAYAANWTADIQRLGALNDPTEQLRLRQGLRRQQRIYNEYRQQFQRFALYALYPV
jgi:SAM-dependent methyltransferase